MKPLLEKAGSEEIEKTSFRRKEKALIDARGIVKRYVMPFGTVEALRGVTLEVDREEVVAIMGPSGSGKSTLMHLFGCLDRPSEGSYRLNGRDVGSLEDDELSSLRAAQIGFVFQSFNLITQLTVYENVEVPFFYQGKEALQGSKRRERILMAIERVGLVHRCHHLPNQLSGGEMQRVAIARALAIDPLLILADEPTGNLDSETGLSILSLFRELNQQGVTLIIVTHDPNVGAHCQRVVQMRDGHIVDTGLHPLSLTEGKRHALPM